VEIIDNKAVVLRTRNPAKYSIIPKHKILSEIHMGVRRGRNQGHIGPKSRKGLIQSAKDLADMGPSGRFATVWPRIQASNIPVPQDMEISGPSLAHGSQTQNQEFYTNPH